MRRLVQRHPAHVKGVFPPAGACNAELPRRAAAAAAAEVDGQVCEPRRSDEEQGRARHGIQADHVPEEPGLHGARVAVPRQPIRLGGVVRLGDVPASPDGQVLAARVVVQVGRCEARLVARIEDGVSERLVARVRARLKGRFEPLDEAFAPAHVLGHGAQVVVRVEGVFPRQRLVVGVAPVAAAAREGVLGHEAAGVAGAEEACEVEAVMLVFQWLRQLRERLKYVAKVSLPRPAATTAREKSFIELEACLLENDDV